MSANMHYVNEVRTRTFEKKVVNGETAKNGSILTGFEYSKISLLVWKFARADIPVPPFCHTK